MAHISRVWARWNLSQQEQRIRRTLINVHYARLNWVYETQDIIRSVEAAYPISPFHRRMVIPTNDGNNFSLQIDAFTDRLLPSKAGQNNYEQDSPGSLVYSLHPNGQIAVIASPHCSEHACVSEKNFIFDVIPAAHLAGATGRLQIQRHLDLFSRLCLISMTEIAPSVKNAKFLDQLRARNERYRNVFQDSAEHRKNQTIQETNFGLGLAAGLMASTLLPMMPEVGKLAKNHAIEISKFCALAPIKNDCLIENGYKSFLIAGAIDVPFVFFLGAILIAYAIWYVTRLLKRR